MNVETEVVAGNVAVLRPDGRLNMAAAQRLRSAVANAVGAGQHRVIVDLTGVSFVDSSGLGALIGGLKSTRQAGGDLRISGATEQVHTVLGLTNLDRVLRPFASVEDALRGW
jgi:anti-anti-sigma factor